MLAQQLLEAPKYRDTLRHRSCLPFRLRCPGALHGTQNIVETGAG
jgi:hypothetical protein